MGAATALAVAVSLVPAHATAVGHGPPYRKSRAGAQQECFITRWTPDARTADCVAASTADHRRGVLAGRFEVKPLGGAEGVGWGSTRGDQVIEVRRHTTQPQRRVKVEVRLDVQRLHTLQTGWGRHYVSVEVGAHHRSCGECRALFGAELTAAEPGSPLVYSFDVRPPKGQRMIPPGRFDLVVRVSGYAAVPPPGLPIGGFLLVRPPTLGGVGQAAVDYRVRVASMRVS